MKRVLFFGIAIGLMSCSSRSGNKVAATNGKPWGGSVLVENQMVVRAKVLESDTYTVCILNGIQTLVLKPRDTVWLDLGTHLINDTSNTTMKAVLLPR